MRRRHSTVPRSLVVLRHALNRIATLRPPRRPPPRGVGGVVASDDSTRVECHTSSRKLEDLIEVVSPQRLLPHDGPYPKCSICMEDLWTEAYDTSSSQPPGVDHLPVRPRICADHFFHMGCLRQWLLTSPSCPLCRSQLVVLTGYQPQPEGANMLFRTEPASLPGHAGVGTIVIRFVIPEGVQDLEHPLPGEPYRPMEFTTFLPATAEGQEVLRLLQLAWHRRLLFRIGLNPETRRMDKIVLNGLELKTNRQGGPLGRGYPDDSYLNRLKSDLREIGLQ